MMINLDQLQKRIYQYKVSNGFNITDICKEFCYTYGEVAEAFVAYREKNENLGEELADVVIYILGIAEILGIDLEKELLSKINKNEERQYAQDDGVFARLDE